MNPAWNPPMNRPFPLVLLLDWAGWVGGGGRRARRRIDSWSRYAVRKPSRLSANTRCSRQLRCVLAVFAALCARGGNWPQWRGPAGVGVSSETHLALHWNTNENVRWRAPLPERGNATP